MVGRPRAEIRETRRGQAAFRAGVPEEPPGGSQSVRSSQEAGNDRGAKGRRKVEVRRTERRKSKPTRVPARASQWWNQPSAIGLGDTERLTDGLGDEAKSRSLSTEHPPTGKPDAGNPPVRFGGRGSGHVRSPYPYLEHFGARSFVGYSLTAAGHARHFTTTNKTTKERKVSNV